MVLITGRACSPQPRVSQFVRARISAHEVAGTVLREADVPPVQGRSSSRHVRASDMLWKTRSATGERCISRNTVGCDDPNICPFVRRRTAAGEPCAFLLLLFSTDDRPRRLEIEFGQAVEHLRRGARPLDVVSESIQMEGYGASGTAVADHRAICAVLGACPADPGGDIMPASVWAFDKFE
jgi:hypothetical protein